MSISQIGVSSAVRKIRSFVRDNDITAKAYFWQLTYSMHRKKIPEVAQARHRLDIKNRDGLIWPPEQIQKKVSSWKTDQNGP
jgi:hypothetical protein